MASEPRSRAARDRAEGALARFGLLAAGHLNEFVVIGGLNPDFLAPAAPVPHSGTTDVDLLFEIGFVYDRDEHDFGWLDRLLENEEFRSRNADGWSWDALLGDAKIRLDLLCDVPDHPGQAIALPGAISAATKNFTGPAPALIAPIARAIAVPSAVQEANPGAPPTISLRFANLGGYLLAKAAAARSRGLPKDLYDLLYVTLYNPGGPQGAAMAVVEQLGRISDPQGARASIVEALSRCTDPAASGPLAFARSMIDAGDDATEAQLRQDAVFASRRFLAELHNLDV